CIVSFAWMPMQLVSIGKGDDDLESIGKAAARLLARLERAAKAKEKDRGSVSGCRLTPTEPLNTGESASPKERAGAPRVFSDRQPQAMPGENLKGPRVGFSPI